MFLGGPKVAKILYIAIYSPIVTMVKPYSHHGEGPGAALPLVFVQKVFALKLGGQRHNRPSPW